MAIMGPRPQPTALKILQGVQPHRINRDEPIPPAGLPVCPVEVDDAVKTVWSFTVDQLAAMGVLGGCDRDALVCYCEAVVLHARASAELVGADLTVKNSRAWVKHPAVQVQRDAASTVLRYAREFGLTPSSRSAFHAPRSTAAAVKDAAAEFFGA